MMGLMYSSYHEYHVVWVSREVDLWDRKKKDNPFHWSKVTLDFLGDPGYQPNRTYVSKRKKQGYFVAECFLYIDKGRPTGTTEEDCWETYRRWGSVLTHLGIQYALLKVEPSSQQPCTWAGTMDHTENVVLGMVSQEK